MKICKKCNQVLPISSFGNDCSRKDGKYPYCRHCASTRQKELREKLKNENPELLKKQGQLRYMKQLINVFIGEPEKHWAIKRSRNKKCYQNNQRKRIYESREKRLEFPERQRAYMQIRNAVRRGDIIKPEVCSICGRIARIQAHHDDYNKPLDVKWVCASCHKLIDKRRMHL
jgi:hypothetical protein